ncbi:hypothetical protein SARC_00454 [Sphaeroforma arctica JP610]|uniref:Uncharacterized protein n=1 Tax=Sphaeroforma arctica JP610 TaxID=667725 RepID=A0A0L0GEG4_9EUKA|nr:hypothetical protein SARC_00454 [Sphaeroforma arctica JP610]KNC87417.1 hypothetical protein SARC_00454 [Sphaeroforma arctica JP610]|eukprot:XP_014161319.1 hypothetical protein SARC_00454 [Sphaeroforma arctica JP610]
MTHRRYSSRPGTNVKYADSDDDTPPGSSRMASMSKNCSDTSIDGRMQRRRALEEAEERQLQEALRLSAMDQPNSLANGDATKDGDIGKVSRENAPPACDANHKQPAPRRESLSLKRNMSNEHTIIKGSKQSQSSGDTPASLPVRRLTIIGPLPPDEDTSGRKSTANASLTKKVQPQQHSAKKAGASGAKSAVVQSEAHSSTKRNSTCKRKVQKMFNSKSDDSSCVSASESDSSRHRASLKKNPQNTSKQPNRSKAFDKTSAVPVKRAHHAISESESSDSGTDEQTAESESEVDSGSDAESELETEFQPRQSSKHNGVHKKGNFPQQPTKRKAIKAGPKNTAPSKVRITASVAVKQVADEHHSESDSSHASASASSSTGSGSDYDEASSSTEVESDGGDSDFTVKAKPKAKPKTQPKTKPKPMPRQKPKIEHNVKPESEVLPSPKLQPKESVKALETPIYNMQESEKVPLQVITNTQLKASPAGIKGRPTRTTPNIPIDRAKVNKEITPQQVSTTLAPVKIPGKQPEVSRALATVSATVFHSTPATLGRKIPGRRKRQEEPTIQRDYTKPNTGHGKINDLLIHSSRPRLGLSRRGKFKPLHNLNGNTAPSIPH